jgi:phosphatidylglycerol:prolipoprotein diacylglycerol transferase
LILLRSVLGPFEVRWYALAYLSASQPSLGGYAAPNAGKHDRFSQIGDIFATVAPVTIFLVRIGNFINEELWGRPTDVPWAMVFPDVDAQARHPSQLYEAGLEGLALLVVLAVIARKGGLKRPGLAMGACILGYGLARIAMEFFREPDPELEQLRYGLTMGMVLSTPMVLGGIALVIYSVWATYRASRNSHAEMT